MFCENSSFSTACLRRCPTGKLEPAKLGAVSSPLYKVRLRLTFSTLLSQATFLPWFSAEIKVLGSPCHLSLSMSPVSPSLLYEPCEERLSSPSLLYKMWPLAGVVLSV